MSAERPGGDGSANKSGVSEQVLSLPSGGGALRGTGGSYMTDLQTGAGNYTIPVRVPDGRNGTQPEVALSYSTGNSHGVAGMGWSLRVASIARKTTDGVPVYDDAEDTFVAHGGGELVAVDQRTAEDGTAVTRYRPRSDKAFARVTRCEDAATDHWVVESKDGSVSYYGTPDARGADPAVVADPDDRGRTFEWQLTATEDEFGNRIEYDYRRDGGGADGRRWDRLYLDGIRYVDYETGEGETDFLVSVSFEYEQRPDPTSSYVAGFEQRTRERLARIAVRTHADRDRTIRSYELTYRDELPGEEPPANGTSQLARVQVVGHDGGETERMPPVEFDYSGFDPEDRDFERVDGPLPRRSLADPGLELADLSGDGLADVVEIDDQVRYWRNRGGGEFEDAREMEAAPAGLSLADPEVQLMDADGDGRIDLVSLAEPTAGYFPMEREGGWASESFRGYDEVPGVDPDSPAVRMLDLDGDGVTDMLRTGSSLECFFQDAEEGWTDARAVADGSLDGVGNLNLADPRMRVADLSGDGLQDVVMASDGHVSYWPNLGHGRWGRRVWMGNPPDLPRDYDPGRLLVGDVDGDGLADLVYVADDRVTLWLNRCGNEWRDPVVVRGTPSVTDTDAVRLVDLKGTGIGGLLYSGGGRPGSDEMYYLDFVGGQKPYLMTGTRNNMGASTRVEHAPSTEFYLRDEREGDGWKTTLPSPTWVVAREESIDRVSGRKLTAEYRYHHGYWDGVEREFRGFGMVEQRDTESFETYDGEGLHGDPEFAGTVDRERFSPPTLTKTWFHLGPVGPEHGGWRELDYGDEYWREDPSQLSRPDATRNMLSRMDRRDRRDAVRTLAGSELRTEVYALDGSDREDRPYRVTEREYGLREEVPSRDGPDHKPVFFPHPVATRSTDWERGSDPRTRFSFVSDYDEHGQPRRNAAVECPQGWRHDRPSPTADYRATYSTTRYAAPAEGRYLVDRVAEEQSYLVVDDEERTVAGLRADIEEEAVPARLTGLARHYYDGPEFVGRDLGEVGAYGARTRTEELVLTDELLEKAYPNGPEPPDDTGVPPYLSASPSWTGEYPGAFRDGVPERAGYVTRDVSREADVSGATTGYFAVTGRTSYDFQADDGDGERGLVRARRDPLGREATVLEYDPYGLKPLRTEDPAGLETEATFDYAAMQYRRVTGPNGNRTEARFSPLGFVTARIDRGDPDEREGDTPTQPGVRYEYDLHAFRDGPDGETTPAYVHEIRRKRHRWDLVEERAAELDDGESLSDAEIRALFEDELDEHPERFVRERSYVDGHGNTVQTRGQAEAEVFAAPDGGPVLPEDQSEEAPAAVVGEPAVEDGPRVRVSEWRTYDNKGNVVAVFEPFHDAGWSFTSRAETAREHPEAFERRTEVFYDALDRRVRVVGPDGSAERVVRGDPSPDLSDPDEYEPTPWVQYRYGSVDEAGRTHGEDARSYDHRWDTPASTRVDIGERKQVTVTRNRQAGETGGADIQERRTEVQYDLRAHEVTVTDELGREAITTVSDLAGGTLRTESLDAGSSWQCYDAAGSALERRDAKGALRLQLVDERGRPTRSWARDGREGDVTLRQRVVYGEDADLDRATARDRNLLGRVQRSYDESGRVAVDAYDFEGDPEAVRQELLADDVVTGGPVDWRPGTGATWRDRAGALLSGREYEMSFERDALGRLRVQRYPEDVTGDEAELHLEYTPSGSLDGAELVVEADDGGTERERYLEAVGHDSKERPVVMAYGNGVLARSAYDDATERLQRQRIETYEPAESASPGTTRLETTGTVHRDVAYTYDVGGNVLESREEVRGVGVAGGPQHTHDGRRLVHDRDALVRTYQYDAVGQLTRATGRECTSIEQPRKWADAEPCGFDDFRGTPDVGRGNAPDQTAMYTEEYSYDPAGNLQSLTHTRHVRNRPQTWTRHFGYAKEAPADWDPSPGGGPSEPVRLTNVGDQNPTLSTPTHEYDDAGNLEAERNSEFRWDHADRLKTYREVKGGSTSVAASYAYSAGGQRAKKVVDKNGHRREVVEYVGGIFEYHRLESDRTADDGGDVTENNQLDVAGVARKRVGTPFGEDRTFAESDRPAVEYQYGDRTGGASLTVDGDGGWVNREEYTPFGETTFGGYDRKRYRYMGTERDEESGLYYQGARYYAPWLCRWTTTDPAGPQDGTNLYAYVRNDPINRSDPTGTQSKHNGQQSEWQQRRCVPPQFTEQFSGPRCKPEEEASGKQPKQSRRKPEQSKQSKQAGKQSKPDPKPSTEEVKETGEEMQERVDEEVMSQDHEMPDASESSESSSEPNPEADSGSGDSSMESEDGSGSGDREGETDDGSGSSGNADDVGDAAGRGSDASAVSKAALSAAGASRNIKFWLTVLPGARRADTRGNLNLAKKHFSAATNPKYEGLWHRATQAWKGLRRGGKAGWNWGMSKVYEAANEAAKKVPSILSTKAARRTLAKGGSALNVAGGALGALSQAFSTPLEGAGKQAASGTTFGGMAIGIGTTGVGTAAALSDVGTKLIGGESVGYFGTIKFGIDLALANPVEMSGVQQKAASGGYGGIVEAVSVVKRKPSVAWERTKTMPSHMYRNLIKPVLPGF